MALSFTPVVGPRVMVSVEVYHCHGPTSLNQAAKNAQRDGMVTAQGHQVPEPEATVQLLNLCQAGLRIPGGQGHVASV